MSISMIMDTILVMVCLIVIVVDTKRGFVKSIMKFGTYIVSLIVAFLFDAPLGRHIDEVFMNEKIAGAISTTVESLTKTNSGYDLSKLTADIPDVLKQYFLKTTTDFADIQMMLENETNASAEKVQEISMNIAGFVSLFLSKVLAFILIIFATTLVLKLLCFILDKIFNSPGLRTANRLLGFVVGVIFSLVVASFISLVMVIIISALGTSNPETFNQTVIENSHVLKFFAKYGVLNFIVLFLG